MRNLQVKLNKLLKLPMTKFERNGIIFIAIIFIPIILAVYYHTVKDFLYYLSSGVMVEASVTSAKTNYRRGSNECDINYTFSVENELYSGNDSLSGDCPENLGKINVFYLKHKPEENVIGFHVLGLSAPIFLVFVPLLFVGKYRNYNNRTTFCVYYIIACAAFLLIASMVIIFCTFYPIAIWDFLSYWLVFSLLIFGYCIAYSMYNNLIKYKLYTRGKPINGIIKGIEENINKDENVVLDRKISYEYELDSKKYTGETTLPEKESAKYKTGEAISLLYCPYKKHVSCIDL